MTEMVVVLTMTLNGHVELKEVFPCFRSRKINIRSKGETCNCILVLPVNGTRVHLRSE